MSWPALTSLETQTCCGLLSFFFFPPPFSVTCPARHHPTLTGLMPSSQMTTHAGRLLIIWAMPHCGFGCSVQFFFFTTYIWGQSDIHLKKTESELQVSAFSQATFFLTSGRSFQPDQHSGKHPGRGDITQTPRDNGSQSSVGRDGTLWGEKRKQTAEIKSTFTLRRSR